MKKQLLYVLDWLQVLFSVRMLQHWTGQKLILPFYHLISDENLAYVKHLYPVVGVTKFEEDLDFYEDHFSAISLDQLEQFIVDKKTMKCPQYHLTFDDGMSSFYTVVAPILERRGISATVFINSAFVDNKGLFYRYKVSLIIEELVHNKQVSEKALREVNLLLCINEVSTYDKTRLALLSLYYGDTEIINSIANILNIDFDLFLQETTPYLTSIQIKDLITRGFTIGAHSVDHPLFSKLRIKEQKDQIISSLNFVKQQYRVRKKTFSFPFTDEGVSKQLMDWLDDDMKCNLTFGISGLKGDYRLQHLHRIPMEDTNRSAKKLIKTEYLYFLLKGILGKNKMTRE